MRPDRAFVLLGSGRRLDLLDPRPHDWTDVDLAVGLSRTYRWGGHSRWELPLSVAQHSLLVLVLRQGMQPHQPLTPREALRELLHDAEEALMGGFDPVSPLRPHLGDEFQALADRLRSVVAVRYALPRWQGDDLVLHKRADRLAAASEALHVVGWPREEVRDTLGIQLTPLRADLLPLLNGLQPWEPWPARQAAAVFLTKLRELQGAPRPCCHRARHRPGHRRGTAMKTRREIEGLKRSWRDDPLWDLENTEGFEEHEEELRNYRLTMEARWKAAEEERERAIDAEAERIGVHGLLRLLRQTEARQQRQHEAIALLAEGRAQDAWRALSGHGEA